MRKTEIHDMDIYALGALDLIGKRHKQFHYNRITTGLEVHRVGVATEEYNKVWDFKKDVVTES